MTIQVEVAFALPSRQRVVSLEVAAGTTAREAALMADMPAYFPDIPATDFAQAPLGVFGKRLKAPAEHVLSNGDRVEIYRPLIIDPMEARRARAKAGSRGSA